MANSDSDPRILAYRRETRRMSRGDFAVAADICGAGNDEVGKLGQDLLSLAQSLEARSQERKRLLELTSELECANRLLSHMALVDGLTGIANRRFFDQQLNQEWRRALRHPTPLSLILFDVDHFKQFNDRYGHPAGDACLLAMARAASGALQRAGDFVARYGGEEFVALIVNAESVAAARIAERIRRAIEALAIPAARAAAVTISLGVATLTPTLGSHPSELIEAADRALYQAKHNGRNQTWTAPLSA